MLINNPTHTHPFSLDTIMNMLSLDDAYGEGTTSELHTAASASTKSATPQQTRRSNGAGAGVEVAGTPQQQQQHQHQHQQQHHTTVPPTASHHLFPPTQSAPPPPHHVAQETGRRQVRFVQDPASSGRHRYARAEVVAAGDHPQDATAPASWLERNKTTVVVTAGVVCMFLIVGFVVLSRQKVARTHHFPAGMMYPQPTPPNLPAPTNNGMMMGGGGGGGVTMGMRPAGGGGGGGGSVPAYVGGSAVHGGNGGGGPVPTWGDSISQHNFAPVYY